jgi:hypothetical protein
MDSNLKVAVVLALGVIALFALAVAGIVLLNIPLGRIF